MSPWIALIGAVVGALTAFMGTIAGQYMAGRAADKRDRWAVAIAARNDKRATIEEFFELYQKIERGAGRSEYQDRELIAKMWITHNRLELIGSDQLQKPLEQIARDLNHLFWHGSPNGKASYEYLRPSWRAFRQAARAELEIE